jgi:hypothetical protein
MKKMKVGAILTQAGAGVGGGFAARKIADIVQDKIEDDMQEKFVLGALVLGSAYAATSAKGAVASMAAAATGVFGEILISSFMDAAAPAVKATKAVKGNAIEIQGDEMGAIHEEIMRAMEGNDLEIHGDNDNIIVGVDDMSGTDDSMGEIDGYGDEMSGYDE